MPNSFSSRFFPALLQLERLLLVCHSIISFPFFHSYDPCKLSNVCVWTYRNRSVFFLTKLSCSMTKEHTHIVWQSYTHIALKICVVGHLNTSRWMLSNDPIWVFINEDKKPKKKKMNIKKKNEGETERKKLESTTGNISLRHHRYRK